jgi:hypothetical protein
MLPSGTVPASLAVLVEAFRTCFTAPTFATFRMLLVGLVAQTGRRTVCGMLLGAGVSASVPHDRAHRFFARAVWSGDQVGLVVARLVVARLLPAGSALAVVVDDTLFRRRGKRVHHAFWAHDASQSGKAYARGNRWVIAGLVVALPFSSRPVCLPVLFRLWAGKGTASPVELARDMVGLLARAFPDRDIHVAGDAAYHGPALRILPDRVTWTTRLPRTAVLYWLAPPRAAGQRGRPRLKGARIGTPEQAAAAATWRPATVTRYGRTAAVPLTEITCLWYGAFGPRVGRLALLREPDTDTLVALFTTDTHTPAEKIVTRYAARWSIEVAIETAKGPMGVGQAHNRSPQAVTRTVPFAMITMSLVIVWYTLSGHHPADVTDRRRRQPWYTTKTEPSFEDMIAKLRRVLIAARFMPEQPHQATPEQIHAVHQAWAAAAA